MSQDKFKDRPKSEVVDLAAVRRRLEAEREDLVAPVRAEFMEEMGELFYDYMDALRDVVGNDPEKLLEEMIATCSTVLALAAEEHSDDPEERVDFIDSVAEIAVELVVEPDTDDTAQDDDGNDDSPA